MPTRPSLALACCLASCATAAPQDPEPPEARAGSEERAEPQPEPASDDSARTASSDPCDRTPVSDADDAVYRVSQDHAACAADADCVQGFGRSGCAPPCADAIHRDGLPALHAARAQVDALCDRLRARGCRFPPPAPCPPPGTPRCADGRCTLVRP